MGGDLRYRYDDRSVFELTLPTVAESHPGSSGGEPAALEAIGAGS